MDSGPRPVFELVPGLIQVPRGLSLIVSNYCDQLTVSSDHLGVDLVIRVHLRPYWRLSGWARNVTAVCCWLNDWMLHFRVVLVVRC